MSRLINLKLVGNNGAIKLNFGDLDGGQVRIVRYQAMGIVAMSPIYITFGVLPTTSCIAGTNDAANAPVTSSEFMLPITAVPNSAWEFTNPIHIMQGDNLTTGTKEIVYSLRDFAGLPYQLTSLALTLEYTPVNRHNPMSGDRQIKTKENFETLSRNQVFTTHYGFDPGLNTGLNWF